MNSAPNPCAEPQPTSGTRFWAGCVLTSIAGLFLLFDGACKLFNPSFVVQASQRLGLPVDLAPGIGMLLLICSLLYLIPRTAVLGAVMLSGYLGGAVAIHLRAGSTTFETVFPVIFALIAWSGVYLREPRLCALLPLRR